MWRVYNLHHTSVFTYSHANMPLGQSEHVYYLSYFIKYNMYALLYPCKFKTLGVFTITINL